MHMRYTDKIAAFSRPNSIEAINKAASVFGHHICGSWPFSNLTRTMKLCLTGKKISFNANLQTTQLSTDIPKSFFLGTGR